MEGVVCDSRSRIKESEPLRLGDFASTINALKAWRLALLLPRSVNAAVCLFPLFPHQGCVVRKYLIQTLKPFSSVKHDFCSRTLPTVAHRGLYRSHALLICLTATI